MCTRNKYIDVGKNPSNVTYSIICCFHNNLDYMKVTYATVTISPKPRSIPLSWGDEYDHHCLVESKSIHVDGGSNGAHKMPFQML